MGTDGLKQIDPEEGLESLDCQNGYQVKTMIRTTRVRNHVI